MNNIMIELNGLIDKKLLYSIFDNSDFLYRLLEKFKNINIYINHKDLDRICFSDNHNDLFIKISDINKDKYDYILFQGEDKDIINGIIFANIKKKFINHRNLLSLLFEFKEFKKFNKHIIFIKKYYFHNRKYVYKYISIGQDFDIFNNFKEHTFISLFEDNANNKSYISLKIYKNNEIISEIENDEKIFLFSLTNKIKLKIEDKRSSIKKEILLKDNYEKLFIKTILKLLLIELNWNILNHSNINKNVKTIINKIKEVKNL